MIANQAVTIQFSILEGGTTNVYQETQNPTTDANGILIVNIGEGTVDSGNFFTIDWGAANHFLNIQVDTGDGLVDLGTTQFKSVPYAMAAKTAADNTNYSLTYLNTNTVPVQVGKSPDMVITLDENFPLRSTVPIDHQKFLDLCGDGDGCTVTIILKITDFSQAGQSYSKTATVTYNPVANSNSEYYIGYSLSDGNNSISRDNDNTTTQILNAFDGCYLTNSVYVNGVRQNDGDVGLHFLYWTAYNDYKTCTCRIED